MLIVAMLAGCGDTVNNYYLMPDGGGDATAVDGPSADSQAQTDSATIADAPPWIPDGPPCTVTTLDTPDTCGGGADTSSPARCFEGFCMPGCGTIGGECCHGGMASHCLIENGDRWSVLCVLDDGNTEATTSHGICCRGGNATYNDAGVATCTQ